MSEEQHWDATNEDYEAMRAGRPLVGPQTRVEQFETIISLLSALATEQRRLNGALADNAARIEVCANNVVGQNHILVDLQAALDKRLTALEEFTVHINTKLDGLPNLVQRNADALLKGQTGLVTELRRMAMQTGMQARRGGTDAVAIKRKPSAGVKKRKRRP